MRTTKYFSLLCDECKCSSKTEQMSVVLRYVTVDCSITESCIGFFACEGLDAVSLSKTILDCLRDVKIDYTSGMVEQCYDDASVMRRIHWVFRGGIPGTAGAASAVPLLSGPASTFLKGSALLYHYYDLIKTIHCNLINNVMLNRRQLNCR